MHKIYSRPRIRIPKIFFKAGNEIRSKKVRKMLKILLVIVIAFSTVKLILDSVLPIFDTLCENEAKSIATIVSNEQATNVMREHTYDELFTIEKDSEGNINMIKSNVIPINEIKYLSLFLQGFGFFLLLITPYFATNLFETYESGTFEGYNKGLIKMLRLIPGNRLVFDFLTVEDKLKFYGLD